MGTPAVRVGIVGAGANTRAKHLPGFQGIPGVEVVAVCNRSPASSAAVAEAFGIPKTLDSWQALVADEDIDAVLIGTWPYLHAPVTLAALAAGKHVLCEARMAMNHREALAMYEASQARPELVAMLVPSPFTLPWDRCIQRLLAEEAIGDLLHVDVFANSGAFQDADRAMTWREDVALSGLNTMMLGIYYEAMARWTGPAEVVAAQSRVTVPRRKDAGGQWREIRIPDHLDVLGRFRSGASLHLRCSQVTGACPTPDSFLLYGSRGTLHLDLRAASLSLLLPGGRREQIDPRPEERENWRVEAEFIGAIRGEEPVRRTRFSDGVDYMRFTRDVARASLHRAL